MLTNEIGAELASLIVLALLGLAFLGGAALRLTGISVRILEKSKFRFRTADRVFPGRYGVYFPLGVFFFRLNVWETA